MRSGTPQPQAEQTGLPRCDAPRPTRQPRRLELPDMLLIMVCTTAASIAGIALGLAGLILSLVNRKDLRDRFDIQRRDTLGAKIDLQGRSGGSDPMRGPHITCVLVNTGAGTAFDVTPTAVVGDRRIATMTALPPMPAGTHWPQQRCYFQLGDGALGPENKDPLPPFSIEVTYRDEFGTHKVAFPNP